MTLQLRKAYFSILRQIKKEFEKRGVKIKAEKLHEITKKQFGIDTTKNLSKQEFKELIINLKEYCKQELGINIMSQDMFKLLQQNNVKPKQSNSGWIHDKGPRSR